MKVKQRQEITLRKVICSAVVLISLASIYLLILVPFVPYAVMRGLTDGNYFEDLEKPCYEFRGLCNDKI